MQSEPKDTPRSALGLHLAQHEHMQAFLRVAGTALQAGNCGAAAAEGVPTAPPCHGTPAGNSHHSGTLCGGQVQPGASFPGV